MTKIISALEAKYEAQKLAFAPFYFQAMVAIRDLGILEEFGKHKKGLTIKEVAQNLNLSFYGVQVLVEAALCVDVLEELDNKKYKLTKIGFFVKSDEMTRVNMNFTNDVCYDGLMHLKESIQEGKPSGLKVFGQWDTVYQALAELPQKVKKSWFEFDHFYSDDAFPYALEILFREPVKTLYDIGGNTGKWAIACCKYNSEVEVKMLDLPGQIAVAQDNIQHYKFSDRISYHPTNILDPNLPIPKGADTVWMSQFLDCFSTEEIQLILNKVYEASSNDTWVYILEPFWNNQEYQASTHSLVATSLYFTCIANGNSKMYHLDDMVDLVNNAGLEVVETFPLIGDSYHTLLKCRKAR